MTESHEAALDADHALGAQPDGATLTLTVPLPPSAGTDPAPAESVNAHAGGGGGGGSPACVTWTACPAMVIVAVRGAVSTAAAA